MVEPISPDRRVETVSGSAGLQRSAKPVSKMESLGEEARPAPSSNEGPALAAEEAHEGRRARKSVNYALPKLNSKMRRPEDYVPAIKGARKSVVPRAPISRQSVQPTAGEAGPSSQPSRVVSREAVPPRPSASQPSVMGGAGGSGGESESEAEEIVVERIKQRRASSLAATRAMRELEDKMRGGDGMEKVAVRTAGRRQSALA